MAQLLNAADTQKCQRVCREWRRLTGAGACEQQLWTRELGEARGSAWRHLLLCGITLHQKAGTHQESYEKLCATESEYDSVIRRDVNRTLPQEAMFRERGGHGQLALFRVLRALAIRLCDVGYCQSLNFIVATLICVFPSDEASVFQCALALLLRYSLADLYRPRFAKLGVLVWQFDRIVEGFLPKVHTALVRHGVNSEFYAIQWFLTLFASDLDQTIVRRVWDRFLVAGWRVVVQVGLALLYTIQDTLPTMDTCEALRSLRSFAGKCPLGADALLDAAASFKVSHRMLSALEAAYNWEQDAQLLVVKDLNSGHVHWAVQARAHEQPARPRQGSSDGEDPPEPAFEVPRALGKRGNSAGDAEAQSPELCCGGGAGADGGGDGEVLPFLLRNLDTGEETVINEAWSQYTDAMGRKARASARPAQARPTHLAGGGCEAADGAPDGEGFSAAAGACGPSPDQAADRRQSLGGAGNGVGGGEGGGSFWMQSVQRQAVRRLGQA